jgi:hypothetical protein
MMQNVFGNLASAYMKVELRDGPAKYFLRRPDDRGRARFIDDYPRTPIALFYLPETDKYRGKVQARTPGRTVVPEPALNPAVPAAALNRSMRNIRSYNTSPIYS